MCACVRAYMASRLFFWCVPAEKIRLALLLPMSGTWRGGPQIAGAARLAVEKVNANTALLPGHRLEYTWANSGCSAKQGLAAMGKLLADEGRVDAVIGPGCGPACEVTSYLAGGRSLPQISYVRACRRGVHGRACVRASVWACACVCVCVRACVCVCVCNTTMYI